MNKLITFGNAKSLTKGPYDLNDPRVQTPDAPPFAFCAVNQATPDQLPDPVNCPP